jgi:hypothetical protein
MKTGRIIGTALLGLFLFLFLAIDLVIFGVVSLDSAVVSIFPVLGLVLGALLGVVAKRRHAPHGDPIAAQ